MITEVDVVSVADAVPVTRVPETNSPLALAAILTNWLFAASYPTNSTASTLFVLSNELLSIPCSVAWVVGLGLIGRWDFLSSP